MRSRSQLWLAAAASSMLSGVALARVPAGVRDVLADAPTDLSVTVYRASSREAGAMDLDHLDGFALIRETRVIRLPPGESRIRFEGVADGIEPVSAIVAGLPVGVVEKNLDADLLSPATLLAAAAGKPVVLVRSNPRTGKAEQLPGTILSNTGGVVFQTSEGVIALRCSGLSERLIFTGSSGLSATPTLSVLVRTSRPMAQQVTLSYLARGFDWGANYTATLSADGKTIDLGAWVTLANGNGVGFPAAHAQVVAGRVNRASGDDDAVEPIDAGGPVLAECWPQGSTSDSPGFLQVMRAIPLGFEHLDRNLNVQMTPMAMSEIAVSARRIEEEQLGDLKLYRVPVRTDFASRQSKQIRLLDRAAIPVRRIYRAELLEASESESGSESDPEISTPASVLLRTRNDAASHLGLPLPSGGIAVFALRQGERLLLNETGMRDLAVNEEVEIDTGVSPDVRIKAVRERTTIDPPRARTIPLVPGVIRLREAKIDDIRRVEVSNARAAEVHFELQLQLDADAHVIRADHPLGTRKGHPVFGLIVPAHATVVLLYQTERSLESLVP
ncbi:MAG: hypothetical protein JWN43_706 [Gammaproteobacteria bacterium]|nr:hypothetical protein [Gammaproteobacteria bacterium]